MVSYRKDNADKLKKYFKEYGEANREKISARSLRRYQNNIQANLATTLRNRSNLPESFSARVGLLITV